MNIVHYLVFTDFSYLFDCFFLEFKFSLQTTKCYFEYLILPLSLQSRCMIKLSFFLQIFILSIQPLDLILEPTDLQITLLCIFTEYWDFDFKLLYPTVFKISCLIFISKCFNQISQFFLLPLDIYIIRLQVFVFLFFKHSVETRV